MDLNLEIPQEILKLSTALAIGLIIGFERGWRDRGLPEGARAAGFRTFALVALFGGILASLPERLHTFALGFGLLILGVFVAIAYWRGSRSGNRSMTTAVAMLVTYVLGAYAALGSSLFALGLSVIVTLLLSLKQTLHGWLEKTRQEELIAGIQLLAISIVILPSLPDQAMGPYKAINPYQIWWAVILIASLSVAGHIAMRAFGLQRGTLWTGLLGGLASSTAVTLSLASKARQAPQIAYAATAGILSATSMMCGRLLIILWFIDKSLFALLLPTLLVSATVLIVPFIWQIFHTQKCADSQEISAELANIRPYSLKTAIGFGLFLALVSILLPAASEWLGGEGVYLIASISGLADVDAITISLALLSGQAEIPIHTAAYAIFNAVIVNLTVKALMVTTIGGKNLSTAVLIVYLLAIIVGAASWLFFSA